MISKIGIMTGALLCGLSMTAAAQNFCPPRPTYGDEVVNPPEVSSQNGTLTVSLAENSSLGPTQMVRYCYEHGVLTISAGTSGNIIRILMPLVISDDQFEEALSVLEAGLGSVSAMSVATANRSVPV